MKIKGLDDKIAPLLNDDPKAEESMPTIRRVLLTTVGNVGAQGSKEILLAYDLTEKIKTEKDHLKVDADELATLIRCVEINPLRFPVAVMGPVLKRLQEAEKD